MANLGSPAYLIIKGPTHELFKAWYYDRTSLNSVLVLESLHSTFKKIFLFKNNIKADILRNNEPPFTLAFEGDFFWEYEPQSFVRIVFEGRYIPEKNDGYVLFHIDGGADMASDIYSDSFVYPKDITELN